MQSNFNTNYKVNVPLTTHKWNILRDLWSQQDCKSLSFTQEDEGWFIREYLDDLVFQLRRDIVTQRRYTDKDLYGLLGVSLLNLSDTHCYITEGVSDFFSAKLALGGNVLGVTNIGGSRKAKKILISLFTSITVLADNDITGMSNAIRWKSFLQSHGVVVDIWRPESMKDITDEFIFNLKLQAY